MTETEIDELAEYSSPDFPSCVSNGDNYWAYLLPMFSFLVLVELSGRVSSRFDFAMLVLRVVVPMAMLIVFWIRGSYPELRIRLSAMTLVDLVVGVALAVVWIGPYVLFPNLRPDLSQSSFDPKLAGTALVPLVLGLRMIGFAFVTPFVEELFMRSFLMRYIEVFDDDQVEIGKVPMALFTWKSFLCVVGVFLATHMMWEWWVMFPWAILTTLWFYSRKDLFAVIVVHAGTNAAILLAAIFASDLLPDGAGGTLPLWFFV